MTGKNRKRALGGLLAVFLLACSAMYINPPQRVASSAFHSSELTLITSVSGNVERMDYINEDGNVTLAANKGFASKTVSRTDNTELEEYFDAAGEPASRFAGYYALLREYDESGNLFRITYLDRDKKPMIISGGYAAEEREYNDRNQLAAVRYLDTRMDPVCTKNEAYGKINTYDENGKAGRITYVDPNGDPMMTGLGYAAVTRTYYDTEGPDNGKVETEFYFDEKGEPVSLSLGQYGIRKEYDEVGEDAVLIYLDRNGEPMVTNAGYAKVVRTFQKNGSVETEMYYDAQGEPVSLAEGQYGINRANGVVVYLNKDGSVLPNVKSLMYDNAVLVIPAALLAVLLSCLTGKRINICLLILYGAVIGYFTLMYREGSGSGMDFSFSFQSFFTDSERRAEMLKNIWLFIPLGGILFNLYPRKRIMLVPLGVSMLIEGVQYLSGTGWCELYDLISNGTGGVLGYAVARESARILDAVKRKRKGERHADQKKGSLFGPKSG